jgi:hypothetical protein
VRFSDSFHRQNVRRQARLSCKRELYAYFVSPAYRSSIVYHLYRTWVSCRAAQGLDRDTCNHTRSQLWFSYRATKYEWMRQYEALLPAGNETGEGGGI